MSNGSPDPTVETFAAPIEGLILALGQGVAEAQRALDQNSIQTQEKIDADPLLSQYGLQATWYQFPSVSMQLKLSLAIAADQTSSGPSPGSSSPGLLSKLHLVAQPLSASFQTHFSYDAQAATQINLTMVPVPPPKAANQSPPKMTAAAVQAAALPSAPFVTVTDAHGNKTPASTDGTGNTLVFNVNFNGVARIWYVIQYAPSNATVKPIVVAVDDATGSARVIATP